MSFITALLAEPPLAFLEHFLNRQQREMFYAIAAILGLVLAFAAYIYWLRRTVRRYQRQLDDRTAEIGAVLGPAFTLHETNPHLFIELLRQISPALRRGDAKFLRSRFLGSFQEGRRMQLMEYGYNVRVGKGGYYTVWQTIAHFGDKDWHFPAFSITPRGFWSRLGLGGRGVRFETHPRFGALYRVKCADEAAARTFLTPALLEALERSPGLNVEGRGNNLLIFRRKKPLEVAEFPQFQADARQLAALFPAAVGQPG